MTFEARQAHFRAIVDSPRRRRLLARMWVISIYVNRNMIGAVEGVQPFGGEGLSGTGPKAGGPHYLYRFCAEQTVTVNTTAAGGGQRGFAGNSDLTGWTDVGGRLQAGAKGCPSPVRRVGAPDTPAAPAGKQALSCGRGGAVSTP